MASIRHVASDRARRAAAARLVTHARRPWEDWREDPPVAELLRVVGGHPDVLRSGVAPALQIFLKTHDPARGLACVYLLQALVTAELEGARSEQVASGQETSRR